MSSENRSSIVNTGPTSLMLPGQSQPVGEQIDLKRIEGLVRRRWPIMLATLFVVIAIGAIYTIRQKRMYEATALMVVQTKRTAVTQQSQEVGFLSELLELARNRSVEGQIQVLTSPDLLYDVTGRLSPEELELGFGQQFVETKPIVPEWSVDVNSRKDSDVIAITAKSYNPEVSANLANTIVRTYLERDKSFTTSAARQAREYVQSELRSVQTQLAKAENELTQYKSKTSLVESESQIATIAGNVLALEMEQDRARIDQASAHRQVELLKSQLDNEGESVRASQTIQLNPQYQDALTRLDTLNAAKARLIEEYKPDSSEVRQIVGEIASAEVRMRNIARNIVSTKIDARNPVLDTYLKAVVDEAASTARLSALQGVVSSRRSGMSKLPQQEKSIASLTQITDTLRKQYQTLSDKSYSLHISEKSTLPSALFVATARVPINASTRYRETIGIFFASGLLLSILVGVVAERLDTKLRDVWAVSDMTGELPLSLIPEQKTAKSQNLLLDDVDMNSAFVESFRILRNNITLATLENPIRLLAVTSPGRLDGKTTAAINLAIAMAMDDKKTLVIDCDLRRPSLHKYLNIPPDTGFTSVVNGQISLEHAIVPTRIENLHCLPAGPFPKYPGELLNSRTSRELFRTLCEQYDIIVLDCPPSSGLSDMQVISNIVDGVLVVVSINRTRSSILFDSMQNLAQMNAPVVGFAVNRFKTKQISGDYYQRVD